MSNEYPIAHAPTPDSNYSPSEVVRLQVEGLARNDVPVDNTGIATAYNFASPSNRNATGPFDRFVKMVTGPQYAPMVDHVEATTGQIEHDGHTAEQRVTLTGSDGRVATYLFGLSDNRSGSLDGYWLTDRVLTMES